MKQSAIPNSTIPSIGLGTFGLNGDAGTKAILAGMDIGYRHIDTAQTYDTEKNVGDAIAQTPIARDDLFITTKITAENFPRLIDSLRDSLANMQVKQADLTLIHWPAPYDEVPVSAYIGELARAQDEGLTRLIGVSNFTRKHLDEVDAEIGEGRIATNQIECHAYLQNKILAQHCKDADIKITAYMPLGRGKLIDDPVIVDIAGKHSATPAQIALAFLLHRDCIIIPKSSNLERQRSNLAAGDVTLDTGDMVRIDELEKGERLVDPEWGPTWD
ncbi:MAG: 2,5-diketo-D-gluconic acid reductase B [Rhizobiales bacterium]|nr:2,5-diketo-D-gluconic acid reductase B [Hyphomicrobiales bacterium]